MIKNLGILFNNIAKVNEKKISIQFSYNEKYSYGELDLLSEQFISFFKNLNLSTNNRIIIESHKNIYAYAMIVASLKMGISYTFVVEWVSAISPMRLYKSTETQILPQRLKLLLQ